MRRVDSGHLSDMTLDVATISASSALDLTGNCQRRTRVGYHDSRTLANNLLLGDGTSFLKLVDQILHGTLLD